MNVALIFAGGTGQRMNTKSKPKQFLELYGKPILIYTIEQFENHPEVDAIVVVCLKDWIPVLQKQLVKYDIGKVADIVPGGETGQASIRNGVYCIHELFPPDTIVLVHDGVRPLIDEQTISACIATAQLQGNAITTVPAIETIVQESNGTINNILDRKVCDVARAPQCFRVGDLKEAHDKALEAGLEDFIDSASLMSYFGHSLYTVEGDSSNIKITTPADFFVFRAMVDVRENSQIFGF